jgi:hypothetical protein
MAKTISQLTEATTVSGSDELIVQQSNVTKRAAASLLMNNAPVLAEGSTTSRSLETRFAEMTNVKDFGAVGDGTTDDTTAINAAIASLAGKGGTIYFPQGNYRITSTITLSGNSIWLQGEGAVAHNGVNASGVGTSIIVDTGNLSGLIVGDADHGGISRMTIQGPLGSARLTGGALVEVGAIAGGGGTFQFNIENCVLQRGYNGLKLYRGFSLMMYGTRIRYFTGDYCVGSVPDPATGQGFQNINMVGCDTSAGDHVEYKRFENAVRSFSLGGMFINSASQITVTLVNPTTGAKTLLSESTDYTVAIGTQGTTVTIAAGVSLTNFQQIIFRRVGGLRGIGTTLCYFNGRTGSHKIVNCTGGFGADGYWFENTTQEGQPGFVYIANGGLENGTGSCIRVETGHDYKIANCYFSSEGYGLDVIDDPAGSQNITGVAQSPNGNKIQLTVPNHGFDGTADLIVSGVLGTDIGDANGRFPAADPAENIAAGYVVTGVNTIDLIYRLVGGNADPVQWESTSTWTPATGNARTRVAGAGDVSVVNTFFRAARKSGIRIDSGYVKIANCKVTTSGAGDKQLFGINVSSLANSGDANKILVTTQYPHGLEVGNLVRFEGLKLSSATQLAYVYGSVDTVVTDTQVKLSATGMDSAGSTVSMAFAGPYDAGTVLLIPSGANVELGPSANDVSIIGNQLGDINDQTDITPYGIWNKSGKTIQILDNNCSGVRRRGIRNDVVSPSAGFSQVWRGNITDQNVFSELIGTGTPESVVTAPVGSLFRDLATGEMYRKNSGAGNTGWQKFTSA